ncbi:FMN-dependent NADH-azoreductase [Caulobacter sp. 17J65-9]|uniref:FMN-dependent NADH-azoreductase n=1 Tax=Caulobacter sp. 17J65-9 TaxID=2709382 RepID=UPI0013CB1957|nr:FMN-dependent NADH-azoreductase [Caulobacter sp. 17J65-9]NEX91992.1 FMN-dependent NADH-azoreductase [Caulobacter sp. 17J65-9]
MNILHVDSSIMGGDSVSRALTAAVVAEQLRRASDAQVTYRDLAAEPLDHLSSSLFAARAVSEDQRSADQQRDVVASDATMDQFLAADVVVIGAPMYNFSIPSQLKAWIDRVAVAGKTFRYTETGPEGLAGGKKVIIVSSRGGVYNGTPLEAIDHQERYLRSVFGFLGVTDVEFVRAEGVNLGPDHKRDAIEAAHRSIADVALAA